MKNTIEYKNYIGSVEYSEVDRVFYGQVLGICSLVSYEGATKEALIEDFHDAVDQYLDSMKETVLAVSSHIIEKNREAYETLAGGEEAL